MPSPTSPNKLAFALWSRVGVISVWLEVRVLPGPPRILVLPEISRKIRPIRRHFAGGALSLRPRRGGEASGPPPHTLHPRQTSQRLGAPVGSNGPEPPKREGECDTHDALGFRIEELGGPPLGWCGVVCRHHLSPTVAMQPAGQDPEVLLAPGTVAVPLRSQPNASPFWIMLLLVSGRLDNGMIRIWQPNTGVA
jgi:hypothetical protein